MSSLSRNTGLKIKTPPLKSTGNAARSKPPFRSYSSGYPSFPYLSLFFHVSYPMLHSDLNSGKPKRPSNSTRTMCLSERQRMPLGTTIGNKLYGGPSLPRRLATFKFVHNWFHDSYQFIVYIFIGAYFYKWFWNRLLVKTHIIYLPLFLVPRHYIVTGIRNDTYLPLLCWCFHDSYWNQ